jgi:hypothetical protein
VKWKRLEADNSPLSNAEVKEVAAIPLVPTCLDGVNWQTFTLWQQWYIQTHRTDIVCCKLFRFSSCHSLTEASCFILYFSLLPSTVSECKQSKSVTLSHLYKSAASFQCSSQSHTQAAAVWKFVRFSQCFINYRTVVMWMCSFTHWQ